MRVGWPWLFWNYILTRDWNVWIAMHGYFRSVSPRPFCGWLWESGFQLHRMSSGVISGKILQDSPSIWLVLSIPVTLSLCIFGLVPWTGVMLLVGELECCQTVMTYPVLVWIFPSSKNWVHWEDKNKQTKKTSLFSGLAVTTVYF